MSAVRLSDTATDEPAKVSTKPSVNRHDPGAQFAETRRILYYELSPSAGTGI